MKKYKAAIFDLDGTLLDTICDLADSMNHGLAQYGFPTLPIEHHRNAVGNGLKKYAERSIPKEKLTPELLDNFFQNVSAYYREHCMVKTKPFEGISELLAFMKEQGISVHILSNKMDGIAKKLVKKYFDNEAFGCVYGEREGVPKKPDPKAALAIAEELNISPSEILFIGDSIYDVITGNAAGMHAVAASWGYQSEERLLAENPAFLAKTPYDIIAYLKEASL